MESDKVPHGANGKPMQRSVDRTIERIDEVIALIDDLYTYSSDFSDTDYYEIERKLRVVRHDVKIMDGAAKSGMDISDIWVESN